MITRHARRAATAAVLLALLLAAGCSDGGRRSQPPRQTTGTDTVAADTGTKTVAEPAAIQRLGSVSELADCGDWQRFSRAQRYEAIAEIRRELSPQRSGTAAAPLSDDRAYAVFERACSPAYASSLRLYKLYVRVQGFAPLAG